MSCLPTLMPCYLSEYCPSSSGSGGGGNVEDMAPPPICNYTGKVARSKNEGMKVQLVRLECH